MASAKEDVIQMLNIIIVKENWNELRRFLSTAKGFRSSQVWRSRVFDRCTPLYSPFR